MPDLDSLLRRLESLEARVAHLEGTPPPPAKKPTKTESRAAEVRRLCDEANKVPVPLLLQHESFLGSWMKWCVWRTRFCLTGNAQGKKADWTPTAAERCLKWCEKIGAKRSMAAIDHSLDRWQDLHEPETTQELNGSQHTPPAPIRATMRL
jgi:hypothetical protein